MGGMCGRFTVKTPLHALVDAFDVEEVQDGLEALPERFNVAPTQEVPVVRLAHDRPARRLDLLRWGLVPGWARDTKIGHRTINARAETVATTPAFRQAFARRRCVVLADGFYEWRREGKARLGHWIRRRDGRPFAMAGLWERWRGPDGALAPPLETCTIVTTDANEVVAPIHDRMPVLLDLDDVGRWLDPHAPAPAALLRPCPAALLESVPVGPYVNDVRHEGPRCLEPYREPPAAPPRAPAQGELFPG